MPSTVTVVSGGNVMQLYDAETGRNRRKAQ